VSGIASHTASRSPQIPIRVIVGPTAAGKSSYAMQLAERENIAIISADSRQIYKGFDIGTAKPSAEDRAKVLHYGVDIVAPTEHYSAYRWAKDAVQWIQDALDRGKTPVIVGGTGFYITFRNTRSSIQALCSKNVSKHVSTRCLRTGGSKRFNS
jgi:tRNA dimethylallyltransferase